MPYPRFQRARSHKFFTYTTGNITINSTTWTNVLTALDITLEAQAGDVIEYGLSVFWSSETPDGFLDVATVVSGTPVTHLHTGGGASAQGVQAWLGQASVASFRGGSFMSTLVTGDITGNTVTLRLRGRTSTASNKIIVASVNNPFHVWAKNLGPVDPN